MVTDEMVEKAADEMARQDITFANCDRVWQKRTIRAALEAALSAAEPTSQRMAGEDGAIDAMVLSLRDPFPSESLMRAGGIDYWRDIMRSAYRSALSAQVQDVAGWEPIETAPKDRTIMLIWSSAWLHPIMGYWSTVQNGWLEYASRDTKANIATHWMPLPAAPAKQEGE